MENSVQQLLTPFNVVESDLALLEEAQFSLALGSKADARKALDAFSRAWPDLTRAGFTAKRYKKLANEL
jgi:hypothetical protein